MCEIGCLGAGVRCCRISERAGRAVRVGALSVDSLTVVGCEVRIWGFSGVSPFCSEGASRTQRECEQFLPGAKAAEQQPCARFQQKGLRKKRCRMEIIDPLRSWDIPQDAASG